MLESYDWLSDRKFADLSRLVTHVDTLIELSEKRAKENASEATPQWKFNLKNQQPGDLQDAA